MKTNERTNETYTIAWVCALPIEQAAAQSMLDEKHPDLPPPRGDTNSYRYGRIGEHDVVIAILGFKSPGTAPAATVAANLLRSFPNIRFGLMVGVGGGAPRKPQKNPLKDIRLGDVVVSTPTGEYAGVIQYDLGKSLEEGKFVRTGSLNGAPTILNTAVAGLRGDAYLHGNDGYQMRPLIDRMLAEYPAFDFPGDELDQLFAPDYSHIYDADADADEDECTLCNDAALIRRNQRIDPRTPTIHYGLIGSANSVLRDAKLRDKLRQELDIMCFEMEAGGLRNDFPCLVIRGICDYCDSHKNKLWQPYAAATAAAYTKRLLNAIAPEAVAQEQLALELAVTLETQIFKLDEIKVSVADVEAKLDLVGLPNVQDAAFNSYVDYDDEDSTCLQGTRINILNNIQTWAMDATGKLMFWLNGMAGTGKSTIARSVAEDFAARKQLAASFFFKRGEHDRENVKYFFSTIATQLTRSLPFLRRSIRKAVDDTPDIGHKALKEQFEYLILLPLKSNISQLKSPALIVVDALDECKDQRQMGLVIKLLSELRSIGSPNLRILLTSRREKDLDQSFQDMVVEIFDDVVLHEITETSVEQDINLYLKYKFDEIKAKRRDEIPQDWPEDKALEFLKTMSSPLFIFAATICRFIGNRHSDPIRSLQTVLRKQHGNLDKLQQTYSLILDGLLDVPSSQRNYQITSFHTIVGTIATVFEPLNSSTLGKLLNVEQREINNMLSCLPSVLRVSRSRDAVVRFLHASFIDYLLNPQEDHVFRINTREAHQKIALRCLDIILSSSCLSKQDICDQRNPGVLREDIDKSIVEEKITAEVRYACSYWVSHLREGCCLTSVFEDQIYMLFRTRFLVWLEALSLLGKAGEAPFILSDLMVVSLGSTNSKLKAAIYDGRRFVMTNTYIVDKAPLQLYSSCLIFAPNHSVARSNASTPAWLKRTPAVPDNWPALLQTLEGHKEVIYSLAYSSSGNLLVSGSEDGDIRLWNGRSGQLQQTLKQKQEIVSVALSHDSKLLASGLKGGDIKIWDISLGKLQHSIPAHLDPVHPLVFSSDGDLLASCSADRTIKLWSTASGQIKLTFEGDLEPVIALAFSGVNSQKLLSCSVDACIKFWDIPSGSLQQSLEGQKGHLSQVTFSQKDPNLLACIKDVSVELWDISGGRIHVTEMTEISGATSICFAPNGRFLASNNGLDTIELWDISSRQLLLHRTFLADCPDRMVFSPDSETLASSCDNMVSIWDVDSPLLPFAAEADGTEEGAEEEDQQLSVMHSGDVSSLAFSQNKEMLASAAYNDQTKLWAFTAGKLRLLQAFDGEGYAVAFSPDGKLLSYSLEETVKIWPLATSKRCQSLDGLSGTVFSIAFSSNSKLVVAGARDVQRKPLPFCEFGIWSVKTRQLIRVLKLADGVHLVACSSTGHLLACRDRDAASRENRVINVWDTNNGQLIKKLSTPNTVHRLELDDGGSILRTNIGIFHLQESADFPPRQWLGSARYNIQDDWITNRGQKLLWLPTDHRETFDYIEELFAFGVRSGTIVFLEFSSEELDGQHYEHSEEDGEYHDTNYFRGLDEENA